MKNMLQFKDKRVKNYVKASFFFFGKIQNQVNVLQ